MAVVETSALEIFTLGLDFFYLHMNLGSPLICAAMRRGHIAIFSLKMYQDQIREEGEHKEKMSDNLEIA